MVTPVFDITTDQRYYSMVVLKINGEIEEAYNESFGDWVFIKNTRVKSSNVAHLIFSTDRSLHRGEQEIFYAEKNNNIDAFTAVKPKKYLYDCLIISMVNKGYICILAPFTELLEKLRVAFIQRYSIETEYLSLNILSIVKRILTNELVTEDLTIKATGLGISKRSSGDISNVMIKGNKPLSTDIGDLVLGLLSKSNEDDDILWYPSNCRFKCITGRSEGILRINLSLNADKYGNYKLYMQKGCLNLLSLLSFLDYISNKNYFKLTKTSPTFRSLTDE